VQHLRYPSADSLGRYDCFVAAEDGCVSGTWKVSTVMDFGCIAL